MTFFKWQDDARRKTRYLIIMMVLVILLLGLATNLLFCLLISLESHEPLQAFFTFKSYLGFTLAISVVVLAAGLRKTIQLAKGGGKSVAESLGGEVINPATADFHEKRLLNVVEEIALASGAPAPSVYILGDERGINAFAAGFLLRDAVIGVTRGAVEQLTRDELEGVIAHEFSHIIHGDMRLNMRLMGIVYGITMLTELGYKLLRGNRYGRRRDGGGSALGLGLVVIGYTGTLFGNIIRAGISRSREYLADAAAVQYTRNNEGIATALSKIGGSVQGSRLHSAAAPETSHMMFGASIDSFLTGMFATHPPLEKRIKKLLPGWDGEYIVPAVTAPNEPADLQQQSASVVQPEAALVAASLSSSFKAMGRPTAKHNQYARALVSSLPIRLAGGIHDKESSIAIIMALMLDDDPGVLKKQCQAIDKHFSQEVTRSTLEFHEDLERSSLLRDRLAVLELAIPALRQTQPEQQEALQLALMKLAHADGKTSVTEWSLMAIVDHHLEAVQRPEGSAAGEKYRLHKNISTEVELLVKAVVGMSGMDKASRQACYKKAMKSLALASGGSSVKLNFRTLNQALKKAALLLPAAKAKLLEVLCECIEHDGHVVLEEAQALRAIAVTLECPVPPLVHTAT